MDVREGGENDGQTESSVLVCVGNRNQRLKRERRSTPMIRGDRNQRRSSYQIGLDLVPGSVDRHIRTHTPIFAQRRVIWAG